MEVSIRKVGALALLLLAGTLTACDRDPVSPIDDHSIGRVEILDRGQEGRPVVAAWDRDGGWTGSLPAIDLSSAQQRVSLGVRIFAGDGTERPLQRDGEYSARWRLDDGAPAGIVATSDAPGARFHGDHVHLYGVAPGETRVRFVLWHFDHDDGETPPIAIRVE